jgi:folate-binding protein YgfZ
VGALLDQVAGAAIGDLPPYHIAPIELGGAQALVAGRPPVGGLGFTLYIPDGALEPARATLLAAGAVPLSAESFDTLRIERGYGAFGRELGQEYIPLETGLLDAVSFTKGCYVGQEIIVRVTTRGGGRVAKRLVRLRWIAWEHAEAGTHFRGHLFAGKKEIGRVTSAAFSLGMDTVVGLGYVHRDFVEPGTELIAVWDDARHAVMVA